MGRIGSLRHGRAIYWLIFTVLCLALTGSLTLALRSGLAAVNVVRRNIIDNTTTMENTIKPGDRLVVAAAAGLRRGDIVIVRTPGGSGDLVARRVIGLPGDHVSCCSATDHLQVDGKTLDEDYLHPGDTPSDRAFSVTLRPGQYWLMGDHRSAADNSNVEGAVPAADISGHVVGYFRGLSFTTFRTPATFVADGLAPADTRYPIAHGWLWLAAVLALALVAQILAGIALSVRRRVHRHRARPPSPQDNPPQPNVLPSPR